VTPLGARTSTFAVIAGGGTAGHVLPGVAIGRALVARGHPPSSIHYVGSSRGIEATLVPEAGFEVTLLPGRGIQRRLTLANVGAVLGLGLAFVRAFWLLRRRRPAVAVCMGGYASVPCALAAVVWRVPIVVAEQNAVPGAANRLVARFARAVAVPFDGTPLPRAVTTGNPVRPEVAAVDRDRDRPAARAALGVDPDRRLLLVVGGSLGALRINRAVLGALDVWRDRRDLAIHHVVGNRDWDIVEAEQPDLAGAAVQYRPVRYEQDMPSALAAADLVVCRAGSSTIFELAAVGVPAVLVPSPHVTGDHQRANAEHVTAAGGAVVVPDAELDGDRLAAVVDALLSDEARLAALRAGVRTLARPDAADAIAAVAERHARRSHG
jgi:undecaprenyldiphospho-muramoylpentapeptide beta-N-acetylglucosaminyltransferase